MRTRALSLSVFKPCEKTNKKNLMKNIKLTNLAIFIVFFGTALIEALKKGSWSEAALFMALGTLSLWADFSRE